MVREVFPKEHRVRNIIGVTILEGAVDGSCNMALSYLNDVRI